MTRTSAYVKYALYRFQLSASLDRLLFQYARMANRKSNRNFKMANPGVMIPDDYALFETYQLDYRKFLEDGELAAKEIKVWWSSIINKPHPRLLDWGCGVGRITRHFPKFFPGAEMHGCDINPSFLHWNRLAYPGIQFTLVPYSPPTQYPAAHFDGILGLSILTHIEADWQDDWIRELYRILQPNGILLLTTHGENYYSQLIPSEINNLVQQGVYSRVLPRKGHRTLTTYHHAVAFQKKLETYFTVLQFIDGKKHPETIGGQDLWIVKKDD